MRHEVLGAPTELGAAEARPQRLLKWTTSTEISS
jgi:hypothetical protein